MGIPLDGDTAVSYTHLDVYKRQWQCTVSQSVDSFKINPIIIKAIQNFYNNSTYRIKIGKDLLSGFQMTKGYARDVEMCIRDSTTLYYITSTTLQKNTRTIGILINNQILIINFNVSENTNQDFVFI